MDSPFPGTAQPVLIEHSVIKANWLTRNPHSYSSLVMALLVFFVMLASIAYWSDFYHVKEWMAASKVAVFEKHQYWRAWTTLFVHGDEKHLLGNALLLFVLGTFLAGYFGLFLVPLSALFFGGLVNLVVLSGMPKQIQLIGISGVVFWMAGAWLVLYFLLETRRTWLQRFLRAGGVGLALFMPAEAFDPSISYTSHLWGFIFGTLWGFAYYLTRRKTLREAEVRETIFEELDEPEFAEGR